MGKGPVPPEGRMSRFALSMSWWTLCSAVFYLYLAPALALSFGTVNAIIGMLLSVLCYAVIGRVYTRRAIRTGMSVEMISTAMFGKRGAVLFAFVLALTGLYYGVFEGSILAAIVPRVFPQISYVGASAIVAAMTIPFIWSGKILSHIERANFILLPLYLVGIVALFYLAGTDYGWSDKWLHVGPAAPSPFGWWNCFVAYMGVWVLLVIMSDFACFGRKEDEGFHALMTFGAPFYIVTFLVNGLIGIFLVGTVQVSQLSETAVVDASLAVLGAATGFAFILATQLRINLANFFVATLNMNVVVEGLTGRRFPNFLFVLTMCAIAFVLMATGSVFKYMLVSLQFMGIILCSWIGVTLFARARDSRPVEDAPAWRAGPTASWLLAAAGGAAMSFAPEPLSSFAAPLSFVGAVVLYALLCGRERADETRARGETA